jgi:hypothetical protein
MFSNLTRTIFLALPILPVLAAAPAARAQAIPNPVLHLTGTEVYQADGKNFVRYKFDVFNKDAFPAALFAAAPRLPPCGKNTKSSRTWLDFYAQNGKRLWRICALTKPADLGNIWFPIEEAVLPPSWVYIELKDRKTNKIYKSNLAETSP